jgi:hypothetical protein
MVKSYIILKYFAHVLMLPIKGHPPKIGIMQSMSGVRKVKLSTEHPKVPPKENDDKGQHASSVSHFMCDPHTSA